MADAKISALSALTGANVTVSTDLFAIVDTSASETKKILVSEVLQLFMPTGVILDYGTSTTVPTGFLLCDGSAVSRTTYSGLFACVSTTWGVGDTSTTFNVLSLARRLTVGSGGVSTVTLGNTVGATGGSETHTLTEAEIPGTYNLNVNGGSQFTVPTNDTADPHNNVQPSAVVQKIIKT